MGSHKIPNGMVLRDDDYYAWEAMVSLGFKSQDIDKYLKANETDRAKIVYLFEQFGDKFQKKVDYYYGIDYEHNGLPDPNKPNGGGGGGGGGNTPGNPDTWIYWAFGGIAAVLVLGLMGVFLLRGR